MDKNNPHDSAQGSRRKFLMTSGAIGMGAALSGISPAVLAQSKAPLKIGVLNSFSKVFAALGEGNLRGMNLYFEQIGGKIAGRQIQVIREDDEVSPQVGLEKIKKLVESDKCDIITGIQASNVAMALVPCIRQSKTFTVLSGAGVSDLSYIHVPYFFRSSVSTIPLHQGMGTWLYDSGIKEVVCTASDFSGGRNTILEFKSGFVKMRGGKVIKEIYPPLGNNDFSAYLADIKSIAPRATFSFYAGTDAVRFVKQYDEYGLKKTCEMTASGFMVESDTLPAQDASALGAISSLHYADTLDNAANKKFVADYFSKYKEFPSVYCEYGYVAAQVMHRAIEACDGNTQDKDKLRTAMLQLKLELPRGPFRFNPVTQSPIQNVYIRKVVEIDGRFTNQAIQTISNAVEPETKPDFS